MAKNQFGDEIVADINVEVPNPTANIFGDTVEEPANLFGDTVTGKTGIEDPDLLTQLSYGYESTPSFTQNLALWAQSHVPIGELVFDEDGFDYKTADEVYGPEFMQADPDTRREMLLAERQKEIELKYGNVIAAGKDDSAASMIGGFGGVLADPTTLLPIGQSYKAMTIIGGLLGLGYSSADQLANKGEIDPVEAGTTAALSAVATPAVAFAAKAASKQIGSAVNKIISRKTDDAAVRADSTAKMDEINEAAAEAVNRGLPEEEVVPFIQQRTGVSADEVSTVIANSETKLKIPTPEEAALVQEAKALQKDPVNGRRKFPWVDDLFGNIHTRIKNVSAPIAGKLRKFELESHVNSEMYMRRVTPFIKSLKSFKGQESRVLKRHLLNGNFSAVRNMLASKNSSYLKHFDEVEKVLQDMYDDLGSAGYTIPQTPNYFPRLVTDIQSLRSRLSPEQNGMIDIAWKQRAKALGIQVSQLSADEKSLIANNIARGYIPKGVGMKLAFTEARTIKNVTDDIVDEYADPIDALHTYIRQTSHNIAKRKFFGKNATDKGMDIDLDDSIGRLIADEVDAGKLAGDDQAIVADLLNTRFGFGEKSANVWVQRARNISYMTTIANPISALTQLGDIGVAAYFNGLRNTFKAIFGKKGIKMEDLGLEDTIAQEFVSTSKSGRFLNKLFKYSGFKSIDKFGKNTLLNGSLNKGKAMAKSDKGVAKLREKYGEVFGDEFDLLVNDLKGGKMSDNVKLFLWNELSDVQPISLTEMPKTYLDNPNGRIFYALKSFTLKQLDLLRNDIYNQIAKGNYKEGGKNFVRYFTLVPLMGATVDEVKDLAMGRGFNPDEVPDNYVNNFFKVFAVSEYARENALDDGKIGTFLTDTATPAVMSNLDAVGADIMRVANGDIESLGESLSVRQLPVAGKVWYNFFGGGLEKWEREQFLKEFRREE